MRIAYMLTSLGIGGAERQVVALAERMAAREHKVLLLVMEPYRRDEWPTSLEIGRLDIRKSPVSLCTGIAGAHRILRAFHPDLVHSHTFHANIAARILHLFGSSPSVISTIHNIHEGGWVRTALYGLTDRLSIHTTAVSEAVANRYIGTGAVPRHKLSVITNGIDMEIFSPDSHCGAEVREQMHAAKDFVWLAAGRLTAAKDYPNLLRGFARIHSAEPRTQLWIAGERNGRMSKTLEILAGELHLESSVHWLGLRDDMPALLDAADAFVLSSAWEGMPLVVAEAMAMQKPVVATDVGGVRELVGDAGHIVPRENSQALAAAMLNVTRTPEDQLETMGNAARERIRRHFDINTKADVWESLYGRLLGGS